MKIVDLLIVASLTALGAGCGGNPCQDTLDALDKASKMPGCADVVKTYSAGIDADNCPTDTTSTKVYEAETLCFEAVKSCDTTGMITLGRCLSSASTGN